MWAQGSGEIHGVFLPPHPWEDLEGIPSLGTAIKLEGMDRASLNVAAEKLQIKFAVAFPPHCVYTTPGSLSLR